MKIRKYIEQKLFKYFHRYLNYYGVEIESNLPPEYIISTHAYERMKQRFGCHESKIKKIAMKAWLSNEKLDPRFIQRRKYNGYYGSIYKLYQGFIFVYRTIWNDRLGFSQKMLITIYKKQYAFQEIRKDPSTWKRRD